MLVETSNEPKYDTAIIARLVNSVQLANPYGIANPIRPIILIIITINDQLKTVAAAHMIALKTVTVPNA
ncbi:Uncharacterised protein [Mycoplasma putrefaciens]|nr:Uncharacterised protein [Mycoplasma putrefaciens]